MWWWPRIQPGLIWQRRGGLGRAGHGDDRGGQRNYQCSDGGGGGDRGAVLVAAEAVSFYITGSTVAWAMAHAVQEVVWVVDMAYEAVLVATT
ncbi:hypothetical protein PR202_ga00389 [Eleusine coracana subsp. coracana]|uniref:Uncharacterized protein n=1 Tax=Eleusine coracana subsp. coracana TaxID=191504 RepID=A0AAV5BEF3_ELECO|nr:hypothetical protein PR202_ga00389 [Eleusine coracana subsp. coracana]